jgi:ABC-type uncharacterized transport system permease subunit
MVVLGLVSVFGKAKFLSEDILKNVKKKKSIINKEGLKVFSGFGCIVIGLEILLMGTFAYIKMHELSRVLSLAICITTIYMFGASQRYDSTNFENGKLKLKTQLAIIFVSLVILTIY